MADHPPTEAPELIHLCGDECDDDCTLDGQRVPPAPPASAELVLPDLESDDRDLTIRPHLFGNRLVICIGWGDEEFGDSRAVALDVEGEARLLAYLTARAEARR